MGKGAKVIEPGVDYFLNSNNILTINKNDFTAHLIYNMC